MTTAIAGNREMNKFTGSIRLMQKIIASIPVYFWPALFLRFLLMGLTGHQDALFIPWISYPILHGNWHIYNFLASIRQASTNTGVENIVWAPNPPISYWTMSAWMLLLSKIRLINTSGWNYTSYSAWKLIDIPRMLFFTKGVYLFADLGAWLILRRLVDATHRKVLDLVWLFSPFILLGTYVMGQTDILAVFWVVAGLSFSKKALSNSQKTYLWSALACLSIGFGAAYKLWPLMLLPLFVIFLGKRIWDKMALLAIGLLPLIITIIPYIGSQVFRDWVLFGQNSTFVNRGQTSWIQSTSVFILAWAAFHFYTLYFMRRRDFFKLWISTLGIMLAFFTLNSFWEFYWLIWAMPFLALAISYAPEGFWLYIIQSVHYFLYMIGGWTLEILVFNVAFKSANLKGPNLAEFLFGTDTKLMMKLLTISFSLFIVASWGILILVAREKWLKSKKEGLVPNIVWQAWIPPALLVVYTAVTIILSMRWVHTPFVKIWNSFLSTYHLDPGFFIFLAILLGVSAVLAAAAFMQNLRSNATRNVIPNHRTLSHLR